MQIGFAYNLKDFSAKGTDAHAEYETHETIESIARVLSDEGNVVHLPCDETFIPRIVETRPDLVFNIAEGWGSRERESFVPIVCRMLGIPFTGSDAVTLGITMDKALTKRVLRDTGVRTSDFELYEDVPHSPPFFGFPAFVKPNCDGSSRGIYRASLITDMEHFTDRVRCILDEYSQSALVEPYLDGCDFCVGLLGNNPLYTLTTCEILLGHEDNIPFFSFEYKRRDVDRLNMNPAVDGTKLHEMEEMARKAYRVLGCLDCSRMDFRTDRDGVPYLLEVNALPGLSPVSGIFVRQAEASGIPFDSLIHSILERTMMSLK